MVLKESMVNKVVEWVEMKLVLPISLITTIGIEIKYVLNYAQLKTWFVPLIGITGDISLLLMILNYIRPKKLTVFIVIGFMLISMFAAPFYWALTPVIFNNAICWT